MVATQIFFIFTPILGEDEPILTFIFFKGVGKNHQLVRDFLEVVFKDLLFIFFIKNLGEMIQFDNRAYFWKNWVAITHLTS